METCLSNKHCQSLCPSVEFRITVLTVMERRETLLPVTGGTG